MIDNKFVMAVIPARGGSKGVPRKNAVNLCGKPLIAYSIDAAKKSKYVDIIVVSTEDEEIAAIAADRGGAEVIRRPPEYATDTAPIELPLRHAVAEVERRGTRVDIVVVLYANVPVRTRGIIDKAVGKLAATGADSVQTYAPYSKPVQWACSIENDKPSLFNPKFQGAYRRQLLQPLYHPDGAVIALQKKILADLDTTSKDKSLMGDRHLAIVQKSEETVDVDEPNDLLWAEFLLSRK